MKYGGTIEGGVLDAKSAAEIIERGLQQTPSPISQQATPSVPGSFKGYTLPHGGS